jgi:hypothetical protein
VSGGSRYGSFAAGGLPSEITPWRGPARGFDFEREVQPVLDRHCIECHDGAPRADATKIPDLRARRFQPDYAGWPVGKVEPMALNPVEDVRRIERVIDRKGAHKDLPHGRLLFTPAYEALFPLVRRVDIEDAVDLPLPGEYHADTSRLVQLLKQGHHGVTLDTESWDRLITWIDLNAPCHGTWGQVYQIPGDAHRRRMELRAKYGGPPGDPETDATLPPAVLQEAGSPWVAAPQPVSPTMADRPAGWPLAAVEATARQGAGGAVRKVVSLRDDLTLELVRVPAGAFLAGDMDGAANGSSAPRRVAIDRAFWMSAREITNRQYREFDRSHDSGYSRDFRFRLPVTERQGRPLNEPDQPVVRVSWSRAIEFCGWLSARTGLRVSLPTELEWEYACRAGTATAFSFGDREADFSSETSTTVRK